MREGGSEMAIGEGEAGAGFQVALEGGGFGFIPESDGGIDFPWAEFRGVGGAAGVVLFEPGVQVVGESDVALGGVTRAAEDVDGGHGGGLGWFV